jgi:hypothetical protein
MGIIGFSDILMMQENLFSTSSEKDYINIREMSR